MNFRHMIESNSFTVVVSLPANDLDLARAALDAGAQAKIGRASCRERV